MFRITDVAKNLLIINSLFFLATLFFGEKEMLDLLALHYPASPLFKPLQLATHFFMHGGVLHLFFNMFALVMFGSALETIWGAKRFLFFYFVCAFGAAALHMGFTWWEIHQLDGLIDQFRATPTLAVFQQFVNFSGLEDLPFAQDQLRQMGRGITPELIGNASGLMQEFHDIKVNIPVVGASGAIYGLLLGFGMLFPNAELMLIFLPIPIKAKYFIPVLMGIELFLGLNQFSWDNIAHFAHLGGAVTGFFLILYWRKFGSRWG
jgi:membrane associated rhomboid family serine protease